MREVTHVVVTLMNITGTSKLKRAGGTSREDQCGADAGLVEVVVEAHPEAEEDSVTEEDEGEAEEVRRWLQFGQGRGQRR
jgi:hypothetical protein